MCEVVGHPTACGSHGGQRRLNRVEQEARSEGCSGFEAQCGGGGSGCGLRNRPQLGEICRPHEQGGGAVPREGGTSEQVGGDGHHRGGAVRPGDSADAADSEDCLVQGAAVHQRQVPAEKTVRTWEDGVPH